MPTFRPTLDDPLDASTYPVHARVKRDLMVATLKAIRRWSRTVHHPITLSAWIAICLRHALVWPPQRIAGSDLPKRGRRKRLKYGGSVKCSASLSSSSSLPASSAAAPSPNSAPPKPTRP